LSVIIWKYTNGTREDTLRERISINKNKEEIMKKLVRVLLLIGIILLLPTSKTYAAEIVESGEWKNYKDKGTWTLDSEGTLTINGQGILSSGGWTKEAVKKIYIEEGITNLSQNLFSSYPNLTEVSLPKSIREISWGVFENCTSLFSVSIPQGVTTFRGNAFAGCTSLEEITIPGSVTDVGPALFQDCTSLKKVVVKRGVKTLGTSVFDGCTALETISFPIGLETIGAQAFRKCTSLKKIDIPKSVIEIGMNAFNGCTNLISIELAEGLQKIGSSAFSNCGFERIEIPDTVTCIENNAFAWNTNLKEVKLSSELTTLEMGLFMRCTALSDIEIPSGVTSIGNSVFSGTAITSIEIPESVTSIGHSAFSDTAITSIVIPESVTNIEGFAFASTNMESIILPSGLTEIEAGMFESCDKLTYVEIPSGVTSIGTAAFYGCTSLTDINLPSNLTNIGDYAFCWTGITSIILPSKTASIGIGAFGPGWDGQISLTELWFTGNAPMVENISADIFQSRYSWTAFSQITAYYPSNMGGWTEFSSTYSPNMAWIRWTPYELHIPSNTEYEIKVVDEMTGKAIANCPVLIGEDEWYFTDEDGCVTIKIDAAANYIGKDLVIGYQPVSTFAVERAAEGYQWNPAVDNSFPTEARIFKPQIYENIGSISEMEYNKSANRYEWIMSIFDPEYVKEIKLKREAMRPMLDFSGLSFTVSGIAGPDIPVGTQQEDGSVTKDEKSAFKLDFGFDVSELLGELPYDYDFEYAENGKDVIAVKYIFCPGNLPSSDEEFDEMFNSYEKIYEAIKINDKSLSSIGEDVKDSYIDIKKLLKNKKLKPSVKFGVDANAEAFGFLVVDVLTGKVDKGGLVVTGEATAGSTLQYGLLFVGCEVSGALDAAVQIAQEEQRYKISSEMDLELAATVKAGVGASGLAEAGVKGKVTLLTNLKVPQLSMEKALKISASGAITAYISVIGNTLESDPLLGFGPILLYPKQEETDSEVEQADMDSMWIMESRNYLTQATLSAEDGTLNQQVVYPNAEPRLAKLEDGRVLAVWLADDGTKSDSNRTTLYYSVLENGIWTTPAAVAESGRADYKAQVAVDGSEVHVLWQRGTEVFADDISMSDKLAKTELVYACFGESGFGKPEIVVTGEKMLYQNAYSIQAKNGTVVMVWMENSENNLFGDTGINSIYTREKQYSTWGAIQKECDVNGAVGDLACGFIGNEATMAYTVVALDGTYTKSLYINSELVTEDGFRDDAVSYQDGYFHWKRNGEICMYLGGTVVYTDIKCDGKYIILSDKFSSCIIFEELNGYSTELYVSYLLGNEYITPVKLTQYGKYIRQYDAALVDGEILVCMTADNVDETNPSVYTTELICEVQGDRTDLAVDSAISYDVASVQYGNTVEFYATVENKGTTEIPFYSVELKNQSGIVLAAVNSTEALVSGDSAVISVSYTIPQDFVQQEFVMTVTAAGDQDISNNVAVAIVGYADLEITDCSISNGVMTGTVKNVGVLPAEEVTVNIHCTENDESLADSILVGSLNAGESYTFVYAIAPEYTEFSRYDLHYRFIASAETTSKEATALNNKADALSVPTHVTGIKLNQKKLTISENDSAALVATVAPANAMNQTVNWTSDATHVATVDEYGVVTANEAGTAIIRAFSVDGDYVAECVVTVEEQKELVKVAGKSLDLQEAINFNYKLTKADLAEEDLEGLYAKVVRISGDTGEEIETIIPYRDAEGNILWMEETTNTGVERYVILYKGIAAKQMNDVFEIAVYDKDGNQVTELSEYSVVSLLNLYYNANASKPNMRSLCVALVRYGAAAQVRFNYDADNLVTDWLGKEEAGETYFAGYEAYEDTTVVNPEDYAGKVLPVLSETNDGLIKMAGKSMELNDAINFNIKFASSDFAEYIVDPETKAAEGLVLKVTRVDKQTGATVETIIPCQDWMQETSNGVHRYVIPYTGIAAKRMRDVFSFAVYDLDGNRLTETYEFTIGSVVVLYQNAQSGMAELCEAILKYGAAAQKQFGYDADNLATDYFKNFK